MMAITEAQKEGRTAGTRLLLDKLHECTKPNVYRIFVDILVNSGNQTDRYLAKYIQGFHDATTEGIEHLQRVIQFHFADLSKNIDTKDILTILLQREIIQIYDREKIIAICDTEGNTMANVHLLCLLHRCVGPGWFTTFVDAVRTTANSVLADQLLHDSKKMDPTASESGRLATQDKNNRQKMFHGDAYSSSGHEEGDMEGDEDTSNDSTRQESSAAQSAEKQDDEGAEKSQDNAASVAVGSDATNMLHEDQLEVAMPGIAGCNTLVIMPAGAGKTHVGASIIQEHIKNAENRDACRVVFLVDKINLVEQQRSLLRRVMKPEECFKIIGIFGGQMDTSLAQVLKQYNVVVLTAAILQEAVDSGTVLFESLSLLVFDECHHCMKSHPYNGIMKKYKHEKVQQPNNNLPQIIGLTASPGTGKAKTQFGADNHLIQICANLDVEAISTPKMFQHVLLQRVNIPEEIEPVLVNGRQDDPLKFQLTQFMNKIEQMIQDSPGSSKLHTTTTTVPEEKSSQSYKQWLSSLRTESKQKITDGKQQFFISTCVEYLEDFHDALQINEEVRTKDAADFLASKLEEKQKHMEHFQEVEWNLFKLSMSKKVFFDEISRNLDYANPLLTKLQELIISEFKNRPESRALLFCQTREGTKALRSWLENTPELKFLCPGRIVGARNMTDKEQNEVLRRFREGKHQMLVATNVAEEGLDVPECNLVFRINYVPSDTGHVQVKGRDRAKDGKSFLVALADSNFEMRELANKAREDMQKRAVESMCKMPPHEFKQLILRQQNVDIKQEQLAEKYSASRKSALPQGGYTLHCFKCMRYACSAVDIGKYKTNFVVLDEEFSMERARFKPHPSPDIQGDVNKIGKTFCKYCPQDWGVLVIIRERKLPVIKLKSFVVRKTDVSETHVNYQNTYKQWKSAPFAVKELAEQDVLALPRLNIPDFD